MPQPHGSQGEFLKQHAASVVAIAHMTDLEAAGRIRLDRLDLLVDMTQHTPWCRPAITDMRVAPVQITPHALHRPHLPQPFDYSISDHWVHPDSLDSNLDGAMNGPVVRMPHTSWLSAHDSTQVPAVTRQEAGMPDDQLVLCSFAPPSTLDPFSFGVWMKILRGLPVAVLWLPIDDLTTAKNLVRQAETAGVNGSRVLFAASVTHNQLLACLQCADLFLDPLRMNAAQGLADAMHLGVPAISWSGNSMASRVGGSILRAAGMGDCVFETVPAYVAEALRLGRQSDALKALRNRLKARQSFAPLFDAAACVKNVETAWAEMVRRSDAGFKPAAFDVTDGFTDNSPAS
jgi:predicted O-linked N-acetylglucosamine transferase (SPINDLY family)